MNAPDRKGGADAERERRRREMDEVEEASVESFPASDPPAFGPVSGAGAPAHPEEPTEPERSREEETS